MTIYQYNPEDWLVSATRSIASYISETLSDPDLRVEADFPDTRNWTKTTPLDKALIHLTQDGIQDPVLGFDTPGVEVFNTVAGTYQLQEAALHLIDYDIGVWVSAETGGVTKRMQLVQALKNLFVPNGARRDFTDATGGLQVVSFDGGRNELDRINDIPVWRAMDMALIVRAVSRHVPEAIVAFDGTFTQDEQLEIIGSDGQLHPV